MILIIILIKARNVEAIWTMYQIYECENYFDIIAVLCWEDYRLMFHTNGSHEISEKENCYHI